MVVSVSPVLGHAAYLIERGEDITIQNFGPKGAVEAFDVGVLSGLARLDVNQLNTVLLSPLAQGCTDKFWPVV
jgi:hypothetical protein